MGAGKTTVAKELAQRLGGIAFDIDEHVENQTVTSVAEIFANEGEEIFRRYELVALEHALMGGYVVIATGGGIVTTPEALDLLKSLPNVVFLDVSVGVALERLAQDETVRPLLGGDAEAAFRKLSTERHTLYESVANLTFHVDDQTSDALATQIIDWQQAQ